MNERQVQLLSQRILSGKFSYPEVEKMVRQGNKKAGYMKFTLVGKSGSHVAYKVDGETWGTLYKPHPRINEDFPLPVGKKIAAFLAASGLIGVVMFILLGPAF